MEVDSDTSKQYATNSSCLLAHDGNIIEIHIETSLDVKDLDIIQGSWYGLDERIQTPVRGNSSRSLSQIHDQQVTGVLTQHLSLRNSVQLEIPSPAKLVTGSVVTELSTNLDLPCVAVSIGNVVCDSGRDLYLLFVKDMAVIPHARISIPSHLHTESCDVHLIDGPNVVLFAQGVVYFTLNRGQETDLPLYSVKLDTDFKEEKCVELDSIGHCALVGDGIVALIGTKRGRTCDATDSDENMDKFCEQQTEEEDSSCDCCCALTLCVRNNVASKEVIDTDQFCQHKCRRRQDGSSDMTVLHSDVKLVHTSEMDRTLETVVYRLCDGKLLKYHIGALVKSSASVFDGVGSPSCQFYENVNGELFLCLQFLDKVVVVRETDLTVIQQFQGCQIFIGDFLDQGTNQMLIVNNHNFRSVETITDFSVSHSAASQDSSQSAESSDSLCLAVRALESRLQSLVCTLRETEQSNLSKCHVIRQTCLSIKSMTLDSASSPIVKQPNILNLLSETPDVNNVVTTLSTCGKRSLSVLSSWQHLIADKWVIGCEVINQTPSPIYSVYISLLTPSCPGTLECKSVIAYCETSAFAPSGDCKRQKTVDTNSNTVCLLPGHTCMLGTSCQVPVFSESVVEATILLHWYEDGERDQAFVMTAGSLCLRADDLFEKKFRIDMDCNSLCATDIQHNLLSLQSAAILTQIKVEVLSSEVVGPNTSLSMLSRVMTSKLEMKSHPLFSCFTRPNDLSLLVTLKRKHRQLYFITVYHRSESLLMAFVHSLLRHLPQNVILSPQLISRVTSSSPDHLLFTTLQQELNYITSSLRCLLQEAKQLTPKQPSSSPQNVNQNRKRHFQECVDQKEYTRVRNELKKLQRETDLQILSIL